METETVINRKSKVQPKLRFQEFEDNWSQLKLGNGIKLISGQHLSPGEYNFTKEGFPYFTGPSDFSDDLDSVQKWTSFSTHFGNKNDILITVKGNGVGTMLLLKLEKVAMGRQLMSIKTEDYNSGFVYQYLLTKLNLFIALASGNLIPGLSRPDILSLKIKSPSLPEQQKIASFLSVVDKKIQQLTRKKELLETYKKGVMQQLFSQEIRLKDEDGKDFPEWEEKKLGDIATFSKGKGVSKNDITEDGITPCIRYGQLYTDYKETIDVTVSKTNLPDEQLVLSEAGDVIIPASGETRIDIATASCVVNEGIALGGDLNIIRGDFKGVFLAYYLNTHVKTEIARLSQGSSVIHLYSNQLKKLKLEIPSNGEQQKIADFLSAIDKKIEAVSQQIQKTQHFKKGLLQQMFV